MSQSMYISLSAICTAICLKILTKDHRNWIKDFPYFVGVALLTGLVMELTSIVVLSNVATLLGFFAFLYFKKSYSIKKATILTTLNFLAGVISANAFLFLVLLVYPISITDLTVGITVPYIWIISLISPVVTTYLLVKWTGKIRQKINENKTIQTTIANLLLHSIYLSFGFQFILDVSHAQDLELGHFHTLLFFFGLGFAAILLVSVALYIRSIGNKLQVEQKEAEQRALFQYTKEIEKQSTNMRKFKHDYQNILTSLGSFVKEKDYEGLTHYFEEKIQTLSRNIVDQNFTLDHLERIKMREIKSILVSKVITAQENNVSIHLEIEQDISELSVDSVTLVRMLGIILDNAMEEVMAIKDQIPKAAIEISIFEEEAGITMVVQNTCRPTIEKLYVLKQEGFSSKGEGRGIGLNNLAELAESQPHVSLQTAIVENQFIQKIFIGR